MGAGGGRFGRPIDVWYNVPTDEHHGESGALRTGTP